MNDYINDYELVFNDSDKGITSGGFSVNSIMMKEGISPIQTLNNMDQNGGATSVADIFNNLVVPNWAFSYGSKLGGGEYKDEEQSDNESGDEIDDDLHNKLLELVKEVNTNKEKGSFEGGSIHQGKKRTRKNTKAKNVKNTNTQTKKMRNKNKNKK
jgi:hypothetical protein